MADEQEEFEYTAIDSSGRRKRGSIKSTSQGRAYQTLLTQGLQPLSVEPKSDNFMSRDIQIPGLEKKAKLKALVIFTKQFALLIESGMPLLESIRISEQQTEDNVLRTSLKAVYSEVERGLSLSGSMEKHPQAFPGLLTSVVRVGEEGGFLDRSMQAMSKTYQTELELKQRIRSAMTYPVIVVGVALAVLTAMVIFVVPIFAEMFENLGADLPFATQVLVLISNKAVIIFPILAVLIIGSVIAYRYFKSEEWMRKRVDNMLLKVPVFGPIVTKTAIARFSRNLSMMLNAGVPLTAALRLVSTTSNNYHIERAVEGAVDAMENGSSLASSMDSFTMFPLMVRQMVSVGERSGSLPPMLDSVADFYEGEVKEASERLSASLEPFLLVVLGVLVGGMLFALYLPMFSLFVKISESGN